MDQTLKGLGGWQTLSGLERLYVMVPGFSRARTGAEISQRLRRISQADQYSQRDERPNIESFVSSTYELREWMINCGERRLGS